MKIASNWKAGIMAIAIFPILMSSCVKNDNYIDWKVMNNEWHAAHKTDVNVTKSMTWKVTNSYLYDKVLEPFQITESGLTYRFVRRGNPAERTPNPTSRIYATYEGKYIDGTTFDSGTDTYLQSLNGLIQAHQEIMMKMRRGDMVEIISPYSIAYGTKGQGIIPPYSTLIFRIELTDVIF